MLKTAGGVIANWSSVAGIIGFPEKWDLQCVEHAVIVLRKAAALEFSAQGIRVNAVNPAVIDIADGRSPRRWHECEKG